MSQLTPVDIELMMFIHRCPQGLHQHSLAPAVIDSLLLLRRIGMIDAHFYPQRSPTYTLTARGQKFLQMLVYTPLPVPSKRWVDPREKCQDVELSMPTINISIMSKENQKGDLDL
jgi:hypothetical protein